MSAARAVLEEKLRRLQRRASDAENESALADDAVAIAKKELAALDVVVKPTDASLIVAEWLDRQRLLGLSAHDCALIERLIGDIR